MHCCTEGKHFTPNSIIKIALASSECDPALPLLPKNVLATRW